MTTTAPVVVGVDGSPQSLLAVDWAADAAARRRRPLHIVHGFLWPLVYSPISDALPGSYQATMRQIAEDLLVEAAERARVAAPGLIVTTELVERQAAMALITASEHAALLVLGNRGLGGFTGLLAGSVSAQLPGHAHCPVVVVREPAERTAGPNTGRIVVGVDGSPGSEHAIRLAFEEADLRGVGLTAVHAYRWPTPAGTGDMLPLVYDLDDLHEDERRVLSESLGGWRGKYPDVPVRLDVVPGGASGVLRAASAGAELLVVGARGRGGFTGLLLGSVSQAMLHHAACPVAITPHRH